MSETEERVLVEAYAVALQSYEQALEQSDELLRCLAVDANVDELAQSFAESVREAARLEGDARRIKEAVPEADAAPGSPLRRLLDRLAAVMEDLLQRTGEAERKTAARRAQLLPEIELQARSRRMERAYGKSV